MAEHKDCQRYAALLEYDGSAFCGWQTQSHAPSVQAEVESALGKVADHSVSVICAGRTDTGVHALGQVIHFDSSAERSLRQWQLGINSNLPPTIALCDIRPVEQQFHARYSAVRRRYKYLIDNSFSRPALRQHRVAWVHYELDAGKMNEAAQFLLGEHDFTSFRALACQARNPFRNVYSVKVERKQTTIVISIEANAFLHHMVRNIAGSLIAVGRGQRSPHWIGELLQVKCRAQAAMTAPAGGLYLSDVYYPEMLQPAFQPCSYWSEFVHTY